MWYEIYRYQNEFQPNGNCVTAKYTPNGSGVNVLNTMVVFNFKITINGTAKLADDANGEGKLVVNFPLAGMNFFLFLKKVCCLTKKYF